MKLANKIAVLCSVLAIAGTGVSKAEVKEVNLMAQNGIGYLQLTVMKQQKLIEKNLAKIGLGDTKVNWTTLGTGSAANDALLSGQLHFASGGTGPAFILWDRTKGSLNVKGVASLSSMPNMLITNNPAIKNLKDFTEKDRISLAGAGSSVQTIYLQMAAAKEFGIDNYKKFNPLMVNLTHPLGLQALLSGGSEVTAQFTSPPFWNRALQDPKIKVVLNSYDIMSGPNTFLMVWSTEKFKNDNPKTYKAVFDALDEATKFINNDKRAAAEIYVAESGGKENLDFILSIMNDPQIKFTITPETVLPFAQFMNDIGTLKNRPTSWKEMFFDNVHTLNGS